MIALIDYGAGNLTSVRKGFAAVGAEIFTPETPADLSRATAVVVPGVGHFAATAALDDSWRNAIRAGVRAGRPLLGICLGLQWLFEGSEEAPEIRGLGMIAGCCTRLTASNGLKVPHVGWNTLTPVRRGRLLEGVVDDASVYFTHAYAAPVTAATAATTTHGSKFASIVEAERVYGVQFHPEKSGDAGLRILSNFVEAADAG